MFSAFCAYLAILTASTLPSLNRLLMITPIKTSKAAEDETDLSKVVFEVELFECYAKGFLEECGEMLTEKEKEMLPVGAMMMTFECGMRFLTDYLEGDTYFRTHREGQNLDRTRTQLKLVADMEKVLDKMNALVK